MLVAGCVRRRPSGGWVRFVRRVPCDTRMRVVVGTGLGYGAGWRSRDGFGWFWSRGGVRERGRLPPREGRMLFVCGPVSSPSGVGGGFWLVGLGGVPGGLSPVAFESAAGVGAGWVAFGDGSFGCWVRFVPFSAGRFWGVAPGVGRRFVGLVGRVLGRGVALLVFEFAPGAGVVSSSWLGGGEVVFDMRVRADDGAVVVSAGRMRRSRCWLRVAFGGAAGVESGGGGLWPPRSFRGVGAVPYFPAGRFWGFAV